MSYSFALLDPRPTLAAQAANDGVFAGGLVLGIEVTVPALAQRCSLGNLDPQHAGGNASRAAIQDALEAPLPPPGSVLVTVRPDLDALGAMAILELRAIVAPIATETIARVQRIAAADCFAHGPWPGPRPLPYERDLSVGQADENLNAIASLVADHGLSITERVDHVRNWLITGAAPAEYVIRVREDRLELASLIASGNTTIESRAGARIAVVNSAHRDAISIGYCFAPVVVARNPAFRFQGGEPHVKYTVAQYTLGHVDLGTAGVALTNREPGWGGSPTIIGSPQGVSSTLSLDDVLIEVERALML